MKRGQIEMIGLVFIVVILVLGVFIYLRFSSLKSDGSSERAALQFQGSTSFLVALKETTIPNCGTSFERVAAACIEQRSFCSGDPCREAQEALDSITDATLFPQGFLYNLSILGTSVMTGDCESADPNTLLASGPQAPIVLSGGTQGYITLSICR